MSFDITGFKESLNTFEALVKDIPADKAAIKPASDKWSLKEILGHLIDSASNNHQRFVRLQQTKELTFPGYDPIKCADVQKCNDYDWKALLTLWRHYNNLLLHVIKHVDQASLSNVWKIDNQSLTLEYLINDYFTHVRWHIDHTTERLKEINVK